jgi:hypothetical protein
MLNEPSCKNRIGQNPDFYFKIFADSSAFIIWKGIKAYILKAGLEISAVECLLAMHKALEIFTYNLFVNWSSPLILDNHKVMQGKTRNFSKK